MSTFALTYREKNTKELLNKTVATRCTQCLQDVSYLSKLCGALANLSLYLIPSYDLEDKRIYSIENVCFYVQGFFSISMHNLLEDLGLIALGSTQPQHLRHILDNSELYECLGMIGSNPRDILFALVNSLYILENRMDLQESLRIADTKTFAKLYSFYTTN